MREMPAIQEFREARAGFRKKEKGRKAGFRKSRNLQIQEGHGKNTGISEIGKRKNTGISQNRYRKLFRYKTRQPCETAGSPKRKKAGILHKQESQPFFRKTAKKLGFCTGENGAPLCGAAGKLSVTRQKWQGKQPAVRGNGKALTSPYDAVYTEKAAASPNGEDYDCIS